MLTSQQVIFQLVHQALPKATPEEIVASQRYSSWDIKVSTSKIGLQTGSSTARTSTKTC